MVVPQAASNENVLATDEDHDAIPNLVALRTNKLPTKANISATRKPAGNINNQTRTKLDHAMLTGKNKTSQLHRSDDTLIYCDAKTTSCMALHPPCPSMLGSLVPSNQILDTLTMEYLAMRARVRAERSVPKQLQNRCFAPYDAVKDQKIRSRLLQIALITQFLDRCFANYFRAAVLPLAKEHVDKLLDDSRKTIAKMQNKQGDPESADIGDLGRFCEQSACAKWHDSWDPNFTTTQRRDHEVLHYLQDALEIPYWEFMADIFLVCNVNSNTLIGEAVLRVLYSAKLDLLDGRRRLRDELALLQGDDAEDIIRITDGIDARITVLESIWDNASSNPDGTHQWLVSLLERPLLSPSVTPEKSSISLQDGKTSRQKETATLMALILVFIVAAIIPGYKAFAISMQENAVGSIHDADFWSLIQSSIMAVMGNIIMVVPLLKKSWLSPTYGLMWAFFALGLVFAVISVVLYPLLNPGWSSMVAFFGSIASVASVLIATQATAREGSNGEVKPKPD